MDLAILPATGPDIVNLNLTKTVLSYGSSMKLVASA